MAQAARKMTAKDVNAKLAHRRLTVLELAERLGNVAEACRRGGIDGPAPRLEVVLPPRGSGRRQGPAAHRQATRTTAVEVVERITELALLDPADGWDRLEALLALEGRRVSAITIQKIFNDKGLGPGTSAGWRWSARTPSRRSS